MRTASDPHRLLLHAGAAVLAALALPATSPAARGAAPRRPNFVFVYTDDHRWDALGVVQREQGGKARFPWLRTPNLDRLAAEGVRFRNAFVVNSLCAPSRASFLTGRYGHLNGVVNNHTPFPVDQPTHASLLRAAGYTTAYVGKWHMGRQRGPRPGFDYSASFVGQGRYIDCPFEVNGKETPTAGWVDDVSTGYAVRFLREHRDGPFLLVVGFKATHGPFQPPARVADRYEGERPRAVPNLDRPPPYRRGGGAPAPAAGKKAGAAPSYLGYFRCITAADDNLGRILQALDDLGLADDTMVVFAGDNGYYLGEHRLGDKRSAYEESLRIPLLLRYPRAVPRGRTVDRIVLNVDLAPTFLDYAGVAAPAAMQGRSWRPLLEGKDAPWRSSFFYAYFYESGYRIPTVTAVRTDTAKLIKYPGHDDWTELFDLTADPYETHDLANDPARAGFRKEMEAEYDRQKEAVAFRVPDFADDPARDRPKPPLNARVLDYRFGADTGAAVPDASGKGNDGRVTGAARVPGRAGASALRFDGKGVVEVPRSPSLDPAVLGWTVEVTFRAERGSGVLVACGGRSNGYALALEDGRPVFTVVARGQASRVAGKAPVVGGWVRLTAQATADDRLRLLVDGAPVAEGPLRDWPRTPNEGLQIGADLGSPVGGDGAPPRFVGAIESVRVESGVVPQEPGTTPGR